MRFQYSPYVLPLIAAAVVSGWVAFYAWSRRRASGSAMSLFWLALAITWWAVCYALEIAGANLATKAWWGKSQYLGIVTVPVCWLIFALNHAYQSRRISYPVIGLLLMVPIITVILVWTTEFHHLIWDHIGVYETEVFSILEVTHGPWFWVHSAYSYLLLLAGSVLIVRALGRMRGLYRGQAAVLLVGVCAPWFANAIYLLGLSPIPHLDLTPFAFALTTVALAWGVFGVQLIDMAPLARDVVVDEMQDAMIVLDVEGRIADMNPAAERLIGQDAARIVGAHARETLAAWPEVIEKYRNVTQAIDEVAVGEGDIQRWYELRILPLKNRRQQFIGRAILIRDITERKQLDDQLRQLSRAVEASPASIVITDAEGHIEYVNPKFSQVTGYTFQEALGQNPRILKTALTPPETYVQLWETLTASQEWRGEFCNRKKNGEFYWEFASISPLLDANGHISHYVAVKEEITERKKAEAELHRYTTELEASNAELDAFAHTVAHDLKNPLTTLLGFSMLMETHVQDMPPERMVRNLHIITRTGQKMTSIINELLLLASVRKVEDVDTGPLDMEAIVTEVLERLAPMIEEYHADIVVPDIWPAAIGYPAWVEEVWINYVSNAIKYGGRPEENLTPHIELGWTAGDTPSAHIRFWVCDNGPGLSTAQRQQLFTEFSRLHEISTEGHGLGLSIVQRIIKKLGGTVAVKSEVGQGSCFYFTLPSLTRK